MSVTLTEAAARHVKRYIAKRGKGVGVRLGVKTTGCSGLAYKLEYADEVAPEDVIFEGHEVKIHCSILAEDAIKAAVSDYKAKNPAAPVAARDAVEAVG